MSDAAVVWEWKNDDNWTSYDEPCSTALEVAYSTTDAGGLRMTRGWFGEELGRKYLVHLPSRKYGGVFRQQNLSTGKSRPVRRAGVQAMPPRDDTVSKPTPAAATAPPPPPPPAPPAPPPAPVPGSAASSTSNSTKKRWADPLLQRTQSVDTNTAPALDTHRILTPQRWQLETEAEDDGSLAVTGVSPLRAGATGAIIVVSTPHGLLLVKKLQGTVCADIFANLLATALHIPQPSSRLLAMGSEEYWGLALACAHRQVLGYGSAAQEVSRGMTRASAAALTLGNARFVLLMEFVKGRNAASEAAGELLAAVAVQAQASHSKVKEDDAGIDNESHDTGAAAVLGRILALDLLTNNWDRFPLGTLWDHEGNLGNIMLVRDVRGGAANKDANADADADTEAEAEATAETETEAAGRIQVLAIDNCTTALTDPEQATRYIDQARSVVAAVSASESKGTVAPCIETLRRALALPSGGTGDIGVAGARALQRGFLECARAACMLPEGTFARLAQEVRAELAPLMEQLKIDEASVGVHLVNEEFLSSVVERAFRPGLGLK